MKEATSSVTLNQVKEKHASPSTHVQSKFSANDFTLGKAEGAVQVRLRVMKEIDCLIALRLNTSVTAGHTCCTEKNE